MRCPACGADNPAGAKKCGGCGERFTKRRGRPDTADESDSPFGKRTDTRNHRALTAYRVGVLSLIPLAGLVLGPAALVLGLAAWRQAAADATGKRQGLVYAALILGAVTSLANGVGVALMVQGLSSP